MIARRVFLALIVQAFTIPAANASAEGDQVRQMFDACVASGGRPAGNNYNDWVSGGGCICNGRATRQVTCSGGGGSASAAQSMALQGAATLGFAIGQAIRQQLEEDAAAAAARAEQDRLAALRRQAEQQRRDQQSRDRLMGSMKDPYAGPVISLKDTNLPDPQHPARGQRIVDCEGQRAVYQRLGRGLGTQREALERARRQIETSGQEARALADDERDLLIKTAYDSASDLLSSADVLRERLKAMKGAGMSADQRREWLGLMTELGELREKVDAGGKAFEAGHKFGQDLPSIAAGLRANALKVDQLLADTGLLEEVGKKLAPYGGPAAVVTMKAGGLGIEWGYLVARQALNDVDLQQARATYDAVHSQLSAAEERVRDARADVAEFCKGEPLQQAERPAEGERLQLK